MLLLLNVPGEKDDGDREWAGRMTEMKKPIARAVQKIDAVEKRVGRIEEMLEQLSCWPGRMQRERRPSASRRPRRSSEEDVHHRIPNVR